MPKKPPRNAYYFFMLDFKEEQRKKGIMYNNLSEVQVAADPSWRQAHPKERAKYEAMAKAEKEKLRGAPDKKFTSNGISLAEIEAQQRLIQEIQEQEIAEIKNFVTQKSISNTLLEEDIFLIDVNAYCFTNTHYLMAESTMLRFSLLSGIKDTYHENINPGRIPIGYASDVKIGAAELGLEMPEEEKPRTDYPKILAYLMDYLKQKSKGRHVPPLYTMPEKVEQVQDFIRQLCISSGEDDSQLRVYNLENLFFYIVNAIKDSADEGYPKQSLAGAQLKKDPFKYTPGLGCESHEQSDKAVECSKSRVQRWAYTVLDKCCPVAGIDPVPGRHIPHGVDIEGVLSFRERVRKISGSNAPSSMGPSCSTSVVDESFDGASSVMDKGRTRKTHTPLRLPKTDYSQRIRQAPELTESNFPSLMGQGREQTSDPQAAPDHEYDACASHHPPQPYLREESDPTHDTAQGVFDGRGLVRNLNNMSLNK